MKPLLLGLAVLIICGIISPTWGNLFQLKRMIEKMTGKTVFNYIHYGCYCGLGGKGKPLDDTDRCCQAHDCCYDQLQAKKCSAKRTWYKYGIINKHIYCYAGSWCKRKSCQCDKALALCLKKTMKTYHRKYRWTIGKKCNTVTPACPAMDL